MENERKKILDNLVHECTELTLRFLLQDNFKLNLDCDTILAVAKGIELLKYGNRVLNKGKFEAVFNIQEAEGLIVRTIKFKLTISKYGIVLYRWFHEDYGFGSEHFDEEISLINNSIINNSLEYSDEDFKSTIDDFSSYFDEISKIIDDKYIYFKEVRKRSIEISCNIKSLKLKAE